MSTVSIDHSTEGKVKMDNEFVWTIDSYREVINLYIMQSYRKGSRRPPSIPPYPTEAWKIPGIQSEANGIRPVEGKVASGAHGKKCLLLAHAEGVLGGLGGVADGLGGRVEDRLALLGGVVAGAGDRVGGLLGGALLAGGLGRACNVVGGTLDRVTSLLEARLLGVGLQAGGSLVGGGLAAGWLLANVISNEGVNGEY
jgi:hypothetical protein